MIIRNNQTDVTTYVVLRDDATHLPKTDITVTDIDLYYIEQGAAISTKIDASALAAADSAHSDGGAFNIGRGVYRIDWPDEAFNGGAGKTVILVIECSGVDTTFLQVELSPSVNTDTISNDALTAAAIHTDVGTELATALLDLTAGVETNLTVRQFFRLLAALLLSKASGLESGSETYRDYNDTKNRIVATISSGSRTPTTRDAT